MKSPAILLGLVLLTACAGRDAKPVAVMSAYNMHLAGLSRDCSSADGGSVMTARAVRSGAFDDKWTGEGGNDGCGLPWAMEISVSGGEAKGLLWRGKAEYNFQGQVNREGKLDKALAGKTPASNGIAGPRFITVNAAFGDEAASGDYSMAAVGAGTCTVPVQLTRHQA